MKKVWVRVSEKDYGYSTPKTKWELGTVVGEREVVKYEDNPSMAEVLSGAHIDFQKMLLVELADGSTQEAWESQTFTPTDAKK
jgi:hypothetical protein